MKKYLLFLLFALSLFLSACASPAAPTTVPMANELKTPLAPQPTADSTALFQIIKPNGTTFGVTLDALKTLPLAQVTAEDKVDARVTEFKEVTLTGSSNPVTLTFEQVDKNTILDFNNHGTLKLSSTYVPKANWTKDVAEITVK